MFPSSMFGKTSLAGDDLPILAVTCLLVHRLEEMGPPPKLEVGERGGLVLDPDRVNTDVIV